MTNRSFSRAARVTCSAIGILIIAGILFACGGGPSPQRGGIEPGPSKPPPSFPAPRDVPIDQSLAAAARKELDSMLQSETPSIRAHAIEIYRDILPEEAEQPILSQMDVPNPIVRFASAMAVGDLKIASAKPRLLQHLNDPDPEVKVAVLYALHRLGDTTHSHELEETAKNFQGQPKTGVGVRVRGLTAMVLGRLNEPSVGNILRKLSADPEASVRQSAEEALFLHDDDRGRNAILAYCSSRAPDDQMMGLRALAQKKDVAYRANARGELTNDYQEVALVAARACGEMNIDDGYGVAMLGAKSGDWRKASLAATAFGAIGRSDSQPYLAELLKTQPANPQDYKQASEAAEVRSAAAAAILRIAKHPKRYTRTGDLIR